MVVNPVGCTSQSLFGVTSDTERLQGSRRYYFKERKIFTVTHLSCKLPPTSAGILGRDIIEVGNLDKHLVAMTQHGFFERELTDKEAMD
jgi:hypothetical protein